MDKNNELPKLFLFEGDLTKSLQLPENKNWSPRGIFYLADDINVVEAYIDMNR